ncbi:hypothetical protein ACQPXS_02425 [Streptomyces sp. CA-142005]|uniref:hypothetical protein n=1 Tax=Streptomyces sp. CA-142005 TaxID=3240052 RepID=UPI003D8C7104
MARENVKDEVIDLRSAGADLGKRILLASVRTPNLQRAGNGTLETERFVTTRSAALRLLAWLQERCVEIVVMGATSDYWRAVYYLLQSQPSLTCELHVIFVPDPPDGAPDPYSWRCDGSEARSRAGGEPTRRMRRDMALFGVRSQSPAPLPHAAGHVRYCRHAGDGRGGNQWELGGSDD